MLAISTASKDNVSINILPCQINHTGPTKVTKRHWRPRTETDGTKTSHFRGRRLRGRVVKIPEKFEGIVLKPSARTIIESVLPIDEDEDDEPEEPAPIRIVEQVAKFDVLSVWGHDQLPAADDQYVKGIEEWLSFAESIHAS